MRVPFNKPYLAGKETEYVQQSVSSGKISGDGIFTKSCHSFFEKRFGFNKCLLTTSCTDALEMAAILLDIMPGDEVIMPSYTFVSTANAFVLRGAKIVFCDSRKDHPGMDETLIESLITDKTKVIVPVHYAGVSCDMNIIMGLADKYKLFVVEDAAQGIDSYFTFVGGTRKPLGSIGHMAAFSFHETKNVQCGEGGMLVINDDQFSKRAEIIREKGTNRSAFFRGEVDKYGWVDIGSSFLPSDILAAFLFSQLENLDEIQQKRMLIWNSYYKGLESLQEKGLLHLPFLPAGTSNNAHMFYLLCNTAEDRAGLISYLKDNEILAVFHYLSLHKSAYYKNKHDGRELLMSDHYSEKLVRLPVWAGMKDETQFIINKVREYFQNK